MQHAVGYTDSHGTPIPLRLPPQGWHDGGSRRRPTLAYDADGRVAHAHQPVPHRGPGRLVRRRHGPRQPGDRGALARHLQQRTRRQARQGRDLHAHASGPHRSGRHDRQPLPLSAVHDPCRVLPSPLVHHHGLLIVAGELAGRAVLPPIRHAHRPHGAHAERLARTCTSPAKHARASERVIHDHAKLLADGLPPAGGRRHPDYRRPRLARRRRCRPLAGTRLPALPQLERDDLGRPDSCRGSRPT